MFGQVLPGFGADARQDVKYAVRQAGFAVDFRQLQGGERGDFTRFKNHGVTGGQRRSGFPQRDLNRVVPGADPGHDTERLAAGIDE